VSEEFDDINSDRNVLYQESMPSYLSLELPGAIRWTCLIMFLFVTMLSLWGLVSLFIFEPGNRDPFVFIYTLLGVVVLSLLFGLYFVLMVFGAFFRSDDIMIKYMVLDDRIIVSNISTGTCIFNFRLDEISFIESTFARSSYLSHYRGKLYSATDFFAFSNKRCLLISSPHDKHKQRIPIGYTEDMMLKLENLLLKTSIAHSSTHLVEWQQR